MCVLLARGRGEMSNDANANFGMIGLAVMGRNLALTT